MSKICQCREDSMRDSIARYASKLLKMVNIGPSEDGIVDAGSICISEILATLESDCVCEKNCKCSNPEPFTDVRKKGDVRCWKCAETISKEEKQSQSPCEKYNHSFLRYQVEAMTPSLLKDKNGEEVFVRANFEQWCCSWCGLVTCLKPNQ